MMKAILVHVDEHDGLDAVMATALAAAKRFAAHLTGVYVQPAMPLMVPVAPEGAFVSAADWHGQDRERGRRLRERFDAFMRAHEVPLTGGADPQTELSASWLDGDDAGDEALGSLGRVFDLTVVGRPVRGAPAPSMAALEAALFESGRPLLIAPPQATAGLGRRLVIAWNGSTETARTIALAMPFLRQAEEVLVLSVEEGMVPGPSGAAVAHNLRANGIMAATKHVRCGGRGAVGGAILKECAAADADLLLKGAYTQSRLRQMVFGGATSHILGAAELPVFMAH